MSTWKRILAITLVASAAVATLLGGIAVYSGIYDFSATGQHTAVVYQVLETSLRRSVNMRAAALQVPDLDGPHRVSSGFKLFRSHCVQCHGAPGVPPQPFALGLNPAPASLVASAQEWPAADIFLIIRQGIKMTGMPAWQYRMNDQEIWDVVAFIKILPTLSSAEYQKRAIEHTPTPARTSEFISESPVEDVSLGDPAAGRKALHQYLCATCHVIPGVVGARNHVGPPLAGISGSRYIAGVIPNTPTNMIRWLRSPTAVDPLSAMPNLGLTEQDARDIAAFLYTLPDTD